MRKFGKAALNKLEKFEGGLPSSQLSVVPRSEKDILVTDDQLVMIRDVWGEEVLNDRTKVKAIVKAQADLAEQTGHALRACINMGRSLIEVRSRLSSAEFVRGLRHSKRAFRGLSKSNIEKLMAVARWWDEGIMPHAQASPHYTVLYEFTTLGRDGFQRALEAGIFRPDVTRNEVIGFKKQIAQVDNSIDVGISENASDGDETEYFRLLVRRKQLLGELVAVRKQMIRLRG